MLRSTLILCALALALGVLATAVTAEEGDGLVRKTFDVSQITTPTSSQHGPVLGALVYYDRQSARQPLVDEEGARPYLHGEELVDLLRTWVRPEAWEEEGVWLEIRGSTLRVRQRADVLRQVEAVLAQLAGGAAERVLLHVEVREEDAGSAGCRISGSLELPPGIVKTLAVTGRVDYVADYEVEIAQGANISNPTDDYLDEGLVVEAIAHPLLDGQHVLLEAYVQFCCLEEMRSLELGIDEECFNQPYRSAERFLAGTVQLPRCSHADAHVTLIVGTGEDVLIPVVSGERRADLRVHVELLDGARPTRMLGLSALTTPAFPLRAGVSADASSYAAYLQPLRLHRLEQGGGGPLGSLDEVIELVHRGVSPERWEEGDERLDGLWKDTLLVTARSDLAAEVRRFLAERETEALRPVELDVAVLSVRDTVVPGPGRELDPELATLVTSGRLPTLSGRWASLRLGTTHNYVADYDVEVAQESRIPDPTVGQSFGGLVANLRPHLPLAGNTVRVDLDLLFARDELGAEPFDSGTQYLGPIEQVRVRRTRLDTSIGVPLGGQTLLDAGPDPANPGARLVVAVSARTP